MVTARKCAESRVCERCQQEYRPTSNRQRWCSYACSPRRNQPKLPCQNPDCDNQTSNGRHCSRCASRLYKWGSYEKPDKLYKLVGAPGGYVKTWVGIDSPHSNATGYAYMHRWVMARHIGRPLTRSETVHHINGDRTDNRIENLELWVKNHGAGQRVDDLVRHMVETYPEKVADAMAGRFKCHKHGVSWWGQNVCHCELCGFVFGGVGPFDAHQINGKCLNVVASRNFYESRPGVWSHMTEKAREKAATAPKKARSTERAAKKGHSR